MGLLRVWGAANRSSLVSMCPTQCAMSHPSAQRQAEVHNVAQHDVDSRVDVMRMVGLANRRRSRRTYEVVRRLRMTGEFAVLVSFHSHVGRRACAGSLKVDLLCAPRLRRRARACPCLRGDLRGAGHAGVERQIAAVAAELRLQLGRTAGDERGAVPRA
jgi:hypothetical protein